MARPVPVMSVMAASEPIWIEVRSKVVVALSLWSKAVVNPVPDSVVPTVKVSIKDEVELKVADLRSGRIIKPVAVSPAPSK